MSEQNFKTSKDIFDEKFHSIKLQFSSHFPFQQTPTFSKLHNIPKAEIPKKSWNEEIFHHLFNPPFLHLLSILISPQCMNANFLHEWFSSETVCCLQACQTFFRFFRRIKENSFAVERIFPLFILLNRSFIAVNIHKPFFLCCCLGTFFWFQISCEHSRCFHNKSVKDQH